MDNEGKEESEQRHVITSSVPATIYRWKRDTTLPEGAILMTPDQVREVLKSKLSHHPTYIDTFLLRKGPSIAAGMASLTSCGLTLALGRVFSTTRGLPVPFTVVTATTFLSVLPTFASQSLYISEPILSGLNISLFKSTGISLLIQTFCGIVFPCTVAGYKVFASQVTPGTQKGNLGWFCRTVLSNTAFTRTLYGCLALQIAVGGLLPFLTLDQFEDFTFNVLSKSRKKNNT